MPSSSSASCTQAEVITTWPKLVSWVHLRVHALCDHEVVRKPPRDLREVLAEGSQLARGPDVALRLLKVLLRLLDVGEIFSAQEIEEQERRGPQRGLTDIATRGVLLLLHRRSKQAALVPEHEVVVVFTDRHRWPSAISCSPRSIGG